MNAAGITPMPVDINIIMEMGDSSRADELDLHACRLVPCVQQKHAFPADPMRA